MKLLIIEDDSFKRNQIIDFLKEKGVEYEIFEYLNPVLRYISEDKGNNISGIILDLGLQMFKDSPETYSLYSGLDLIYELKRLRLEIPVLINSTTDIGMLTDYPFVYGQRTKIYDYQMLEEFITFLTEREEQ